MLNLHEVYRFEYCVKLAEGNSSIDSSALKVPIVVHLYCIYH